jgi:hypothetical protein
MELKKEEMIKYRDLFIKHNNKEMIRYRKRKYARGSQKFGMRMSCSCSKIS